MIPSASDVSRISYKAHNFSLGYEVYQRLRKRDFDTALKDIDMLSANDLLALVKYLYLRST